MCPAAALSEQGQQLMAPVLFEILILESPSARMVSMPTTHASTSLSETSLALLGGQAIRKRRRAWRSFMYMTPSASKESAKRIDSTTTTHVAAPCPAGAASHGVVVVVAGMAAVCGGSWYIESG